jgi:hypothetical protein
MGLYLGGPMVWFRALVMVRYDLGSQKVVLIHTCCGCGAMARGVVCDPSRCRGEVQAEAWSVMTN